MQRFYCAACIWVRDRLGKICLVSRCKDCQAVWRQTKDNAA